ncbi:MAG: DUF2269 family protein [Nitrospiraceae bacterium]
MTDDEVAEVRAGWWKVMADRHGDPKVVAFAEGQVTLTDFVFTGGGAVLVLGTGVGNAVLHGMNYLSIRWLAWSYWFFVVSGVIWIAILIPVQMNQARMARLFADGGTIPDRYWRLGRIWIVFGILATILPLANL